MFALMVLKYQHDKKNILLVILAHLVGNIKALVFHIRASRIELSQRAIRNKLVYFCLVGGKRRGERR